MFDAKWEAANDGIDIPTEFKKDNEKAQQVLNKYLENVDKKILKHPLTKLVNEVDEGLNIVKTCHLYLKCRLAVILDDKVMLPYEWDLDKGKFVPGFFSGGISV